MLKKVDHNSTFKVEKNTHTFCFSSSWAVTMTINYFLFYDFVYQISMSIILALIMYDLYYAVLLEAKLRLAYLASTITVPHTVSILN